MVNYFVVNLLISSTDKFISFFPHLVAYLVSSNKNSVKYMSEEKVKEIFEEVVGNHGK